MDEDRSKPNGVSETASTTIIDEPAAVEEARTNLEKTASRKQFARDPRKSKGVRNEKTDETTSRKVKPL